MKVSIKRDGLTLRGELLKPENVDKCPIAVIFHGLMSSMGTDADSMFYSIAHALLARKIASVRFDFSGHGSSDGAFRDMTVLGELIDAAKIIEYVRGLDFVSDIYIVGHSQGALVGSMISGYFREFVSKQVLLAPAATIKDDALNGNCFGKKYDSYYVPEYVPMRDVYGNDYELGNMYYRFAKTLPIYETASMFEGKTLIMHGTADEAVGVIGADRYVKYLKNVTLERLKGGDHGFTNHRDYAVRRTVEFLEK